MDDEVWADPTQLAPPLDSPLPPMLNTHEMSWDSFERLILAIARTLEGAFDVRRYGRPGQAQHGLDVVASFTDRERPTVYQAKRLQKFGAADLTRAVERYTAGRRPFGADRLVIGVASEAGDTETIERLEELRGTHSDIQIELWDRQSISDRLRNEPRLVTTFFGASTAATYCAVSPPPVSPAGTASIAADAILRGPIAHLGLAESVRRAEESLEEQPGDAAELLSTVADRLEESGFVPHAAAVRGLEARALHSAGRRADEAAVRIELGWRHLNTGDAASAQSQVQQLYAGRDGDSAEVLRCQHALAAAIGLRRDYAVTLDHLASAVDALLEGDPNYVDALLILAEEAVTARRPEIVQARAELIERVATSAPRDTAGQFSAARLRMCVADCCNRWDALAATARESYPPGVTALMTARHARYLALVPQPDAAIARWRDAIERACIEQLNDDAADWLYALRATTIEYGLLGTSDPNELHRHALALRAAGSGSMLPGPYSVRERGLDHLREQKWPDALEALRRYLWRSTVCADWVGELDAHDLLGDLFRQTGRAHEAVRHYVVAGETKKLKALAEALPEKTLQVPIDLITPRPWEREAAFSFAAAAADLVPDDQAQLWCAAAFDEITDHPQPAGFLAPNPWIAAFEAFGNLAEVCSEENAMTFLQIAESLIERKPETYRRTDEAQVRALISVGRRYSELRSAALDQLLAGLLLNQPMATLTLAEGSDLLRDDPERTANHLKWAAAENQFAALALVLAAADPSPAIPLAQRRFQSAIAPRVHQPGVKTIGTGLPQTALLVTVLPSDDRARFARSMVDFAHDQEESALNRCEALIALGAIAPHLPDLVRTELFEAVLPIAQGKADATPGHKMLPGADDPFRRVRISIWDPSLSAVGVQAAATLASSAKQYEQVADAALPLQDDADDRDLNSVALALAAIPEEYVTPSAESLSVHSSPSIRALSGVLWAQRLDQPEDTGLRLAHDRSVQVRRSLAAALRGGANDTAVRAILIADPRRSVRTHIQANP
ncbi:MAG TPA: hypothetical protein VNF24_00570 [Candidatus Acidoferrales bacterium]|nr:hypothetical protein [Candidatus Acidoferrales bacterium]